MGDRTTVNVQVRKRDIEAMLAQHNMTMEEVQDRVQCGTCDVSKLYIEFSADECNYGNWDEIEDFLGKHGIEYNYHWHAGCGYPAGTRYGRKDERQCIRTVTVEDYEQEQLNVLEELLKLPDDALRTGIISRIYNITPWKVEAL
jgi:hypothetical protein